MASEQPATHVSSSPPYSSLAMGWVATGEPRLWAPHIALCEDTRLVDTGLPQASPWRSAPARSPRLGLFCLEFPRQAILPAESIHTRKMGDSIRRRRGRTPRDCTDEHGWRPRPLGALDVRGSQMLQYCPNNSCVLLDNYAHWIFASVYKATP